MIVDHPCVRAERGFGKLVRCNMFQTADHRRTDLPKSFRRRQILNPDVREIAERFRQRDIGIRKRGIPVHFRPESAGVFQDSLGIDSETLRTAELVVLRPPVADPVEGEIGGFGIFLFHFIDTGQIFIPVRFGVIIAVPDSVVPAFPVAVAIIDTLAVDDRKAVFAEKIFRSPDEMAVHHADVGKRIFISGSGIGMRIDIIELLAADPVQIGGLLIDTSGGGGLRKILLLPFPEEIVDVVHHVGDIAEIADLIAEAVQAERRIRPGQKQPIPQIGLEFRKQIALCVADVPIGVLRNLVDSPGVFQTDGLVIQFVAGNDSQFVQMLVHVSSQRIGVQSQVVVVEIAERFKELVSIAVDVHRKGVDISMSGGIQKRLIETASAEKHRNSIQYEISIFHAECPYSKPLNSNGFPFCIPDPHSVKKRIFRGPEMRRTQSRFSGNEPQSLPVIRRPECDFRTRFSRLPFEHFPLPCPQIRRIPRSGKQTVHFNRLEIGLRRDKNPIGPRRRLDVHIHPSHDPVHRAAPRIDRIAAVKQTNRQNILPGLCLLCHIHFERLSGSAIGPVLQRMPLRRLQNGHPVQIHPKRSDHILQIQQNPFLLPILRQRKFLPIPDHAAMRTILLRQLLLEIRSVQVVRNQIPLPGDIGIIRLENLLLRPFIIRIILSSGVKTLQLPPPAERNTLQMREINIRRRKIRLKILQLLVRRERQNSHCTKQQPT